MTSNKKRIIVVLALLTMALVLSCAFVACNKVGTQDAKKTNLQLRSIHRAEAKLSPLRLRKGLQ